MGMNDTETVALIGGGHAFGKSHGACPLGPGDPPKDAPDFPWPGNCGSGELKGKGANTATSGFEGQWTTNPLKWDNEYFTQLIEDNYTLITGAGGEPQWLNGDNGYMMLTTDLAFIHDDKYFEIVADFAEDIELLNHAFGNAWEKLTTIGGGWSSNKHCLTAAELDAYNKGEDGDSGDSAFEFGLFSTIFVLAAHLIL